MDLIIGKKSYKSKKITGKLYEEFLDVNKKIEDYQEKHRSGYDGVALQMMREWLVAFFDNQFTEDELLEKIEVSTIIVTFMCVEKTIQDQVTSKLEKIAKN